MLGGKSSAKKAWGLQRSSRDSKMLLGHIEFRADPTVNWPSAFQQPNRWASLLMTYCQDRALLMSRRLVMESVAIELQFFNDGAWQQPRAHGLLLFSMNMTVIIM